LSLAALSSTARRARAEDTGERMRRSGGQEATTGRNAKERFADRSPQIKRAIERDHDG
jgi:hypothetical protein